MIREILSRWTNAVLWSGEAKTVKDALHLALASRAVLRDADLTGAVLRGADLTGAVLTDAVLTDAVLTDAVLTDAVLTDAVLTDVPIIPHIDAAILEAINGHPERLDMSSWHTCETTHCRAGWAVNLAGKPGLKLEQRIGPAAAGALIYAASRPKKAIPNFYASTDEAMKDLQACAKRDPLPKAKKAIRRKAQQ